MGLEEIRRMKMEAKLPKDKKKYVIPKVSEKKKKQIQEEKTSLNGPNELRRWFAEQRKLMTGKCSNCGMPSCRDSDEYFHFSIAHLLPKAYFPSIKTNPHNWIELCFWGNNCHAQMDNKLLDLTEMNCWDEIVVKFQKIYQEIAPNERRRIPSVLLQYLNTDQ